MKCKICNDTGYTQDGIDNSLCICRQPTLSKGRVNELLDWLSENVRYNDQRDLYRMVKKLLDITDHNIPRDILKRWIREW